MDKGSLYEAINQSGLISTNRLPRWGRLPEAAKTSQNSADFALVLILSRSININTYLVGQYQAAGANAVVEAVYFEAALKR